MTFFIVIGPRALRIYPRVSWLRFSDFLWSNWPYPMMPIQKSFILTFKFEKLGLFDSFWVLSPNGALTIYQSVSEPWFSFFMKYMNLYFFNDFLNLNLNLNKILIFIIILESWLEHSFWIVIVTKSRFDHENEQHNKKVCAFLHFFYKITFIISNLVLPEIIVFSFCVTE